MKKIGFIGTGNIARAIITGLAFNDVEVTNIYVSSKANEIWEKSKEKLKDDFGVNSAENNSELVEKCDYVFLALEPHVYKHVIEEVRDCIRQDHIFISLAPNFSIAEMSELIGEKSKIVRVIPNIPVTVCKGMAGMVFKDGVFTEGEKNFVIDFFKQIAHVELINEKNIDMIPAVSGSAPAYMYILLEAMADAAVLIGFPRKLAYTFASQAMIGAGTMVQVTGKHPCELKDIICTPGGTTVEAIKVLENRNYRDTMIEAMLACYDKSNKLK